MSRYKVRVGSEFWVEAVDIKETEVIAEAAKASGYIRAGRARHAMAFVIVGAAALALVMATGIGLYDGSFDEVEVVWSIASLLVGGVVGAYLRVNL